MVATTRLPDFQTLMEPMLEAESGIDRYIAYLVARQIKSTRCIRNDPILLRLSENHFWLSLADSDMCRNLCRVNVWHRWWLTLISFNPACIGAGAPARNPVAAHSRKACPPKRLTPPEAGHFGISAQVWSGLTPSRQMHGHCPVRAGKDNVLGQKTAWSPRSSATSSVARCL
jgi:hypothetical protein